MSSAREKGKRPLTRTALLLLGIHSSRRGGIHQARSGNRAFRRPASHRSTVHDPVVSRAQAAYIWVIFPVHLYRHGCQAAVRIRDPAVDTRGATADTAAGTVGIPGAIAAHVANPCPFPTVSPSTKPPDTPFQAHRPRLLPLPPRVSCYQHASPRLEPLILGSLDPDLYWNVLYRVAVADQHSWESFPSAR